MRARHIHGLVASAMALLAVNVLADDPAQQANAIMHDALLARAARAAASTAPPSGAPQSATAIVQEHMSRTGRAQAERAAHQRAIAHGSTRSGAGRPDREMRAAGASTHGGSTTGSWSGMGCQDAASNWRTMDSHGGEWMHGGSTPGMPGHDGMPSGGGMGGGMLIETSPAGESAASKAPSPIVERAPGH